MSSSTGFTADTKETAFERVLRTKTLRCGYSLYPPYAERNLQTGELMGTAHDVIEKLGETLGWKIDWAEEIPVGQDVEVLKSGRVDAVCLTADYDPNIYALVDASQALFYLRNKIYARADDARFSNVVSTGDLNKPDIRFAGIEGDATSIYARLLFPKAQTTASLPQMSDVSQAFLEVTSNKADLIIAEGPVAQRALKNNPGKFRIVDFTDNLPSYAAVVNVAKGENNLRLTIDHAIQYMNVNGVLDELLSRDDPEGVNYIPLARPYRENR